MQRLTASRTAEKLVGEVAGHHRAVVVERQVVQVEEALQAAQEHLELEQDLLAAVDRQRAQPALPLGQEACAQPLAVLHQLEEEIAGEAGAVGRHARVSLTQGSQVREDLAVCL
ncbi:MAG: hypothetical protein QM765_22650 [Myxococcales bacterium]